MTHLEQLKAALEAATPERWDTHFEGCHAVVLDCQDVTICRIYQQPHDTWKAMDNAEFIALAHNMMPTLLEAVELLRAVHYEFNEYDDEYWATDLFKRIEQLKEKLK